MPEIIQLSDILPIPQSYLHEKYNIPLPEPGEPIARRQAQPLFSVPEGDSEEEETDEEAAPDEGQADTPEPDKKAAEEDAPTSRKVKHADRDRGNFFTRLFDFFRPRLVIRPGDTRHPHTLGSHACGCPDPTDD